MEPALYELLAEGSPDDEVAVILRLNDPVALPAGVRIIAQFGSIVTCRLRRGDIPRVRGDAPVRSMKAARLYGPTPASDASLGPGYPAPGAGAPEPCGCPHEAEEAALDPMEGDQRRPDGDLPTGEGIVIAHIDWGVDFAHPDFRTADGSTRLLSIWDQSAPYDPRSPNRYGFGRIYDADDIDRALWRPDPYAALGYDPASSDRGPGSHGTHTLGISAGNGRAGGPLGLAPGARLGFVHLSTYTAEGPTLLGDSVALLEGLDFIARLAGPRPVVVNASLGRQAGDHTGTTLTEQGMDAFLLGAPGRAIVQSTGNYYDRDIHARGTLRPGARRILRLITDVADRTPNEVDLWYPGVDRFRVTVRGPGGTPEVEVRPDEHAPILVQGRVAGNLYHRLHDPNNGDNQVMLVLYPSAPPGEWEVILDGEDVADGRFHAWVERDAACARCQARFSSEDSDPTSTTGTICNGLRTLAVGAYDAHSAERPLGAFSSSGPTRDGRQKPDLVAPGVRVLSARSGPHRGELERALLARMSGTSMAAPHVTGTIALMFEAAGRPLFIEETRRLLLASAEPTSRHDGASDRLRFGSGYLDTAAAVHAARRSRRTLVSPVQRPPPAAPVRAAVAEADPMETIDRYEGLPDSADAFAPVETEAAAEADYPEAGTAEDAWPEASEWADTEDTEAEADAAERKDDRGYRTSFDDRRPLPFQFQIPLGGGPPGLAVPIGGAGSPFAFSVPLGSTPTPVVMQPVAVSPTPAPAAAATTSSEPPVTVASGELPLTLGERVLQAAEGRTERGSAAWLDAVLGEAVAAGAADGESDDAGPAPFGLSGQMPSATTLFNTFGQSDHPAHSRDALRRHYAPHFAAVAEPGRVMPSIDVHVGDLLLRIARGEGWGRVGVVASPELHWYERLPDANLRGEGYPAPAAGWYVHVVEAGPLPHPAAHRFARRVSDAAGKVLGDTLLLRITAGLEAAEAEPAVAPDGLVEPAQPLGVGARGESVRDAQRKLNRVHADAQALGLPGLRGCPLPEDGQFGQRMQQAVSDFQQQVFSDPAKWDGAIGLDTSAQLDLLTGGGSSPSRANGDRPAATPQPATRRGRAWTPPRPRPSPPESLESAERPTIRHGSQGQAVREAQDKLNAVHARQTAQGAPGLPACPLVVDGVFGDNTKKAVVGFQQIAFPAQSSEWDGVVGPKTWVALEQAQISPLPAPPIPPPAPIPPGPVVDERIDVCAQFALQRMQRGAPAAQADAAGMLGAVRGDQLAGIVNHTTRAAVRLAERHGVTRFDLIPKGEDAALVLEPTDPLVTPPSIVFRGVETKPGEPTPCPPRERLDPALRRAWATFVLLRSGQLARCELPGSGPSTAFEQDAKAFPVCAIVPNLFPQILGQLKLPPTVQVVDISEYVSLDFVMEPFPTGVPSVLTRGAPFRTLSSLDQNLGLPGLATALIGGPIRLDPADHSKFQTRIRMQLVFPASPANPKIPAGTGKLPLAVLVHGHHVSYALVGGVLTDKESFRGYRYLQEALARSGIASISVDTNIANKAASLIELRADMVLAAIKVLKRRASRKGDPLLNRIDFNRIALMGHSRGGDAVVRVVKKNSAAGGKDKVGIRTVCSLAPTDFTGGQVPADRTFLDRQELDFYSVLYGALDGDVAGRGGSNAVVGTGFRHYDRARCQKALVFVERCCHNSFNSIWHADGIERGVRAVDRVPGKLVDEATHQRLAMEYIGGQFAWHLRGTTANRNLFNGNTPTTTKLKTVILWSFGSALLHVDDFENPSANLAGGTRRLNSGAVVADIGSIVIPPGGSINDHVLEQSHVVHADTAKATGSPFGVDTTLAAGRRDLSSFTILALDVGAFFDTTSEPTISAGAAPTFSVILHDGSGAVATVPSSQFSPAMGKPFFHEVASPTSNVSALRLETLQSPLSAFAGINLHDVVKIQVEVGPPSGHLFVDHIKVATP